MLLYQLVLLQVFLCPAVLSSDISMYSWGEVAYRYLRYLPENWVCAMTSIFPSPTWEIWTISPRFPTRPSTLILSCRNFSNAATSKILSLAGCEALIMNFRTVSHFSYRKDASQLKKEAGYERRGRIAYLLCELRLLARAWLLRMNLAYCITPQPSFEGGPTAKRVMYVQLMVPFWIYWSQRSIILRRWSIEVVVKFESSRKKSRSSCGRQDFAVG